MVRVTQPSGGTTQLDTREDAPAPKAVRVLKPPGGGSSISFGEDPEEKPRKSSSATGVSAAIGGEAEAKAQQDAKAEARQSEPSTPSSPGKTEEAAEPSANGNCANGNSANGNSANGNGANGNAKVDAVTEVSGTLEKVSLSSSATVDSPSTAATESTTNGATNGTAATNGEAKTTSEESFPKVTFKEPEQTATEAKLAAAETNAAAAETKSAAAEPNAAAAEAKPAAEASTGNGCSSPDTSSRLFGSTANGRSGGARETPSNHHMRSSIFSGEDDYGSPAPPPSKARDTPKAAPSQQPPTRVRQPPGGFSTKLW